MTILDKVQDTFSDFQNGEMLSRSEIINLVHAKYGVTKGSIIPSDYCYNLVNKDKLSNRALFDFNLFKWIDSKTYIYIGKDQKYTGPIFHKIDLKYEQVGYWTDGVRTLESDSNRKAPNANCNRVEPVFGTPKRKPQGNVEIPSDLSSFSGGISDRLQVSRLWNSGNQKDWENAIDDYWGAVKPENLRIEKEIENLDPERVRSMSAREFFDFLHDEYFVWKYTAPNRLATTRRSLEKYQLGNMIGQLGFIHRQLFEFDRADIGAGLEIAKQIYGLGTAGASGLLAILFPKDFGTVDQFVVKALCTVEGLKEHAQLERMKPESLTVRDGVLIISILRRKAKELNKSFGTNLWTPRMVDKVLWSVGRV